MKNLDRRIKKRIGALVTLTILVTIVMYPAITAVTIPPNPPAGDSILMEDEDWIGNYNPATRDHTGSIHFMNEGVGQNSIHMKGANVGIGCYDEIGGIFIVPMAKLHVRTDRFDEWNTLQDGVWFDQRFNVLNPDMDRTALRITPEFSNVGTFANINYYGANVEPVALGRGDYIGIRSGLHVLGAINNWYGVYVDAPNVEPGGFIFQEYAMVTEADAGNVGLGMINPEERLVVNGAIRIGTNNPAVTTIDGTIRYSDETTPGIFDFEGRLGGNWVSLTGGGGGPDNDWEVIGGNDVVTGHGGSWPAGNVGIGEVSPTAKAHITQNHGNDAFRVDDVLGDNTPFIIDCDGNVGIGTDTPIAKLNVLGNVAFGEFTTANGDGAFATGLYSTAEGDYSSVLGGIGAVTRGEASIAIGNGIEAAADHSIIIGCGWGDSQNMINNIPDSLMIGFHNEIPTMFVDGNSVGVGTVDPVTTLDVNGGLATNIISFVSTEWDPIDYDVTRSDHTIIVDAIGHSPTINLRPADEAEGQILVIKRVFEGSWYVTIDPSGTETIDGVLTYTLTAQWETIGIQSDGENWFILYK